MSTTGEEIGLAAAGDGPVLAEAAPVGAAAAYAPSAAMLRFQVRMWSGFIFAVSFAILALGAYMTPSAKGIGTHSENFHLPPCGLYATTGVPCPTCGCTTAVTHVAHGLTEPVLTGNWKLLPYHWGMAFVVQPFGAAFGFAALTGLVLGAMGLATGRWRGPQPMAISWRWRTWLFTVMAMVAFGWVYKIMMTRGH